MSRGRRENDSAPAIERDEFAKGMRFVKERIGRDPLDGRKISFQCGEIFSRQEFQLDADFAVLQLKILQSFGELIHRIFRELAVDPQIADPGVRSNGGRFHIDSDHGRSPVSGNDTDRMPPTHQGLGWNDKT